MSCVPPSQRVVVSRAPSAKTFWLSRAAQSHQERGRADRSHQERGHIPVSQMNQHKKLGIPRPKGYTISGSLGNRMHRHIPKYHPGKLGILCPEGHASPRSPGKGMYPHIPNQERGCIPISQTYHPGKLGISYPEGHASHSTASLPPLGTLIPLVIFSILLPRGRSSRFLPPAVDPPGRSASPAGPGARMQKKMGEAVARVARKVNDTVENKTDSLGKPGAPARLPLGARRRIRDPGAGLYFLLPWSKKSCWHPLWVLRLRFPHPRGRKRLPQRALSPPKV